MLATANRDSDASHRTTAAFLTRLSDSLDRPVLRRRLARVVHTVRSVAGFAVYDPQLERVIESDDDLDEVVAAVGAGAAAIDEPDDDSASPGA
jgi:hypothetical protein